MNIPLLFKIFLFLIFNQAANNGVSLKYETTSTIVQSFPVISILVLEGDQPSVEDAVNSCSMVFPLPVISRKQDFEKGIFVARLEYKDFPFSTMQQLEQRLYQFKNRINIHWNENHLY